MIKATIWLFVALHCTNGNFFLSSIRQNRSMGLKLIGSLETNLYVENLFVKSIALKFSSVWKILKHGVMHSGFLHFLHQIPVHLLGILSAHISDHDPLQAKHGLLGFLLLPSVFGISWGRCKSMGIATVPCVLFCALWHQNGGLFSEQFTDPSVIR